jgi:hypothetical protein
MLAENTQPIYSRSYPSNAGTKHLVGRKKTLNNKASDAMARSPAFLPANK